MSKAVSTPLRQPFKGLRTTSYSTHEFKGLPLTVSLFAEEVETSGLMGDPTKASAQKGKILYNKMIDYLAEFMGVFKKLDPSAGK
jgi:creatinine amidohydrolase/Fe(II)-dependent formamide hydrolase-like protein